MPFDRGRDLQYISEELLSLPRTSQQTSDSGIPASPVQLKPVLGVSGSGVTSGVGSGVGSTGSGVGVTVTPSAT